MTRSQLARFVTGAALGALMLSPASTLAQGAERTPMPGFTAADSDGDGTISPAEWAEWSQRVGPRMRGARAGASGPRHAERAAAMVRLFDADGDGMLSAEEIETGLAALGELRGSMAMLGQDGRRGGNPAAGGRWSERGDRESRDRHFGPRGEGRQDDRGARGQARTMAGAFDRIDTDGDGMISREEWQAAMERWSEMRGAGPRGPGGGRQ